MESILEVLTPDNLVFIFKGFGLTLYISLIAIVLSTLIGTVLAVMRNGKNPVLRIISSIYIEFVRNVPNLLWIFTIFLVFKMKSTPAGITAFTLFTSAALAEIIRGGLNAVDKGQYEAGMSQGFTSAQILYHIILPEGALKVLREKGYEGKELIFGIRPEDVNAEPAFLETFPESVVKATISVSELLGSESHLYCQVGKDEFVAKVDARDYLQTGATVELGFDLNKAHFFDVETERTVY